jgi:hypothetical protein
MSKNYLFNYLLEVQLASILAHPSMTAAVAHPYPKAEVYFPPFLSFVFVQHFFAVFCSLIGIPCACATFGISSVAFFPLDDDAFSSLGLLGFLLLSFHILLFLVSLLDLVRDPLADSQEIVRLFLCRPDPFACLLGFACGVSLRPAVFFPSHALQPLVCPCFSTSLRLICMPPISSNSSASPASSTSGLSISTSTSTLFVGVFLFGGVVQRAGDGARRLAWCGGAGPTSDAK